MSSNNLNNFLSAMKVELGNISKSHPQSEELDEFYKLYKRFLETKSNKIDWSKIEPPKGKLFDNENLKSEFDSAKLVSKLAVLKLNGGLGTTMGCDGPKSGIKIKDDNNFLDITMKQLEYMNEKYGLNIPLVLMNSFNTENRTRKMMKGYGNIKMFNQSMFPRISVENLLPIENDVFYPPGHGDLFYSLKKSGMLDELLGEGKEYLFVSNVDNLAATVDLKILNFLVESDIDFGMEVTEKTRADIKGGTLINYEGTLKLLEIAQVPLNKKSEFKSVKNFKIFNTNSVWINLKALKNIESEMKLDLIQNRKMINNNSIIQLETAIGSAVQYFPKNCGIVVPRSRFLPVKTCSDLFIVESNLYSEENGFLKVNFMRVSGQLPVIKLIGDNFDTIENFNNSFEGIPDIIDLDILTVVGNVTFGKNVVLKGTVIINATNGGTITIPEGAILEDKILCGSLPVIDL